jgi:succinate dehydrogenase/fumarate reductase flavoprotein subunit
MADFDETFDVIAVGSGAGGMAAAVTAATLGLKAVVLEKTAYFGGSTAVSGGAVWIPCNSLMDAVGHSDDRERVIRYLRGTVTSAFRSDMIDAFVEHGARMVDFMAAHTAIHFVARAHSPDYSSSLDGASMGGRTLDPAPFDARVLGRRFAQLRPPYRQFMALGGMMVDRKDAERLLGVLTDPRSVVYASSLIARYASDRARFARGTRLLLGNALAGRLLKSAVDAGIDLRNGTSACALIAGDGRIQGVVTQSEAGTRRLGARRGVVLATGGFAASLQWRRAHVARAADHVSLAPEGNTGDGLQLALEQGAALEDAGASPVFCTPVSQMTKRDGTVVSFPHLVTDRQKPGLIAVDARGRRFTDESASYHAFVQAMHRMGAIPAFLICDRRFLARYGLGLVRPAVRGLAALTSRDAFVRSGYLVEARDARDLAGKLGMDAAALEDTIARNNDHARTGVDAEFGRGTQAYSRYLGDPAHGPNPCIATIETAPFYAVRVMPGDIGSARGLRTNPRAQVLRDDRSAIEGLYACGNDMNSIMGGDYPAAGITLGPALTFGYIAGQDLAGRLA